MAETTLEHLIPELRLYIYDLEEPYTFSDSTLLTSLNAAVKLLGRRWNHRYLFSDGDVSRNSEIDSFKTDEPPVIEYSDEALILLQASIVLKTAQAYDSTWDIASWKDDEISYSNIQGAKSRDTSLQNDLELLDKLLKQRLHAGKVVELPGFHRNTYENPL